jgi:hypothetical protein
MQRFEYRFIPWMFQRRLQLREQHRPYKLCIRFEQLHDRQFRTFVPSVRKFDFPVAMRFASAARRF